MSLVNDLLIEAERRRGATERRSGAAMPVDDLVPIRPRRRAAGISRDAVFALGAAALIGGLAVVASIAWLGREPKSLDRPRLDASRDGASATRPPDRPRDSDRATPPPVAARRAAPKAEDANRATEVAIPPATTSAPEAGVTSQRPVQIQSISLERLATATQIRLVGDGRTAHRLERDDAKGQLELVLAGAALVEATAPLDLLDTPIRALDVRSDAPDLHLVLTLDPGVSAQTRWLDVPGGAALVLDLQAPRPLADLDAPAALDPAIGTDPADPADRVVSPSLGDPAELRIERSERDRIRQERAATRAALAEALAAARRARAEGRLEDADDRYAEIALLAPEDWTAVCEWADLLVARERPDDALALVERARLRAPRHQGLLITAARLLEAKGDRPGALALLDGAGLALTEAPDVHALAAAYHQRSGDHAAAIERYEQLLRRFPEESRSWMGLGISLEAVGRRDEARDVYRISLQVGELPRETRRWVGTRIAALGERD